MATIRINANGSVNVIAKNVADGYTVKAKLANNAHGGWWFTDFAVSSKWLCSDLNITKDAMHWFIGEVTPQLEHRGIRLNVCLVDDYEGYNC